ncbi:MAG: redoxin domain-containing protein [Candidatus Binatus sp.]|uniref:redoxin domain-containing protein n=1 Tax=Candidatus Binatus sp. TaxID=2811406 RepID=UPI0027237242|nr:redoxin domain-containing protein [Candidatus Binatus sp.]MDO8434337.1 redoxin domain-containing protein [Candidatus Binatus sp.]
MAACENPECVEPAVEDERTEEVAHEEAWMAPPFQPVRAIAALILTACGFGLYEYVLVSFWSVGWMGIHDRIPWPAFLMLAAALGIMLAAIRLALSLCSPHAKLGFSILAILGGIAVGVGGGRFVSYTMRGTLNPLFELNLAPGDRFPAFALSDQNNSIRHGASAPGANATLIYVYRGDYCPFARYELADLTAHAEDFRQAGVEVIAISADQADRSKMLSRFLRTSIPLLGDNSESVLAPLGLVQHHRNGEPDNAIPAFFVADREGVVRWIFTSPYYRELPTIETLLDAAKSAISAQGAKNPAPPASP